MSRTVTLQKSVAPSAALLFERIKAGDEEAFNELYSTHRDRVLSAVKRFITEPDIAEHIANGVFMKVWQVRNHTSAFRGTSAFATWLTRIAYNTALMHIRSGKTERLHNAYSLNAPIQTATGEFIAPDFPYHDKYLEGAFYRKDLTAAIAQLPEVYRKVFVFRLIEGMNIGETGRALNLKNNVVKSRLFRGRQFLRAILGPERKTDTVVVEHVTPVVQEERTIKAPLRKILEDCWVDDEQVGMRVRRLRLECQHMVPVPGHKELGDWLPVRTRCKECQKVAIMQK